MLNKMIRYTRTGPNNYVVKSLAFGDPIEVERDDAGGYTVKLFNDGSLMYKEYVPAPANVSVSTVFSRAVRAYRERVPGAFFPGEEEQQRAADNRVSIFLALAFTLITFLTLAYLLYGVARS